MTDTMYACKCGFKCVDTQLAKSEGFCPRCGEGREDMTTKFAKAKYSKRVM